ncbi:LysR family transcriptional regulator [Pseudonocardia phyllosphaerae]|uniref:LysR family transcriptional regulator n=1 Tax=Pseudonocardia phyllosphaerae TaxID=3390502 RepID=UPI00397E6121
MELQQLRYVIAVAETRNFTRAAERCHVVQSALSHRIAGLERELGVRLFLRTNRRVDLTPSGAAFLQDAREALAAVDRARSAALAASGELTGRLLVGSIPNLTALDLNASLRAFRDRHPGVDLQVIARRSEDMYQAVLERSVDIAFIASPIGATRRGVVDHELARDRLELVVWPGHRLAGRARVRLADLVGEEFVDFPAQSHARAESDAAFDQAGLTRRVCVEVDNTDAFRAAIAARLGIGMLPRDPSTASTGLLAVQVEDAPRRTQRVIWAKPPSLAALALIDELPLSSVIKRSAH